MNWSEAIDLTLKFLPALVISWLITGLLLIIGWLALVEGLQGSDFVILHLFEVFMQGKDIAERELSLWRAVFGMLVFAAGVVIGTASMLTIFVKALAQAMAFSTDNSLNTPVDE